MGVKSHHYSAVLLRGQKSLTFLILITHRSNCPHELHVEKKIGFCCILDQGQIRQIGSVPDITAVTHSCTCKTLKFRNKLEKENVLSWKLDLDWIWLSKVIWYLKIIKILIKFTYMHLFDDNENYFFYDIFLAYLSEIIRNNNFGTWYLLLVLKYTNIE